MEINIDDRRQQFIHALFVGDISVYLAPNKQHVGQQLQDLLILEKLELLVSTIDILFYLLVQKTVRLLHSLLVTVYFLAVGALAFMSGFLGTLTYLGAVVVVGLTPVLAYYFKSAQRLRLA